jgi:hypothetical protein
MIAPAAWLQPGTEQGGRTGLVMMTQVERSSGSLRLGPDGLRNGARAHFVR